MRLLRTIFRPMCYLVLTGIWLPSMMAQVCPMGAICVLTQHNDSSRTGQNLQETSLNTANVNVTNFGKMLSLAADGNIYAQPLYVSNVSVAGGAHNVLYVATAANNIYAFDADSGKTLWTLGQNALGTPVPSQDICVTLKSACPYTDTVPVIGIIATPVIDPTTETMYVVVNTKSGSNYHFYLHALDITTGQDKLTPADITASGLRQLTELSRPGLLLANGMVYLAMGSVGDFPTWHGYVMAYDASTLQQVAVYNSTPQNNSEGGAGIWQSGNGLVGDSNGNVYAVTSNGNFDVNTGGKDYGSAYLKLDGNTLSVLDYFVPFNQASLNPEEDNVDLGSGGPLLIPDTTLLVGTGKDAVLRVVDTTNMGHYSPSQNNNVQNIAGATNPPVLGSPVYWNSPSLGPSIYLWGEADGVKAWGFNGTNLNTTPVSQGNISGAPSSVAALSISAHGTASGTGILWATRPTGSSDPGPSPGLVYAFDANDLTHELWDSGQNSSRDTLGNWAKFNPPTVANGKVYVPTFCPVDQNGNCSGPAQVVVYGLLVQSDFALAAAPSSQSVAAGSSASYIVYITPQGGFNGTVTLTCSGLPTGTSCAPASVSVPAGSNGQVSTPLTVTTSASAPATNFTITATSGSFVHTTTATITVTGSSNSSFTMTPTPLSPGTIAAGASATSQVTIAPIGSFNGTVTVSCAVTPMTSVPPTCSLNPASVNGARGTVAVTVNTVGSTALLKSTPNLYYGMLLPFFGLALAGTSRPRRKQFMSAGALLLVLLALVWMAACGGGTSGGGGGNGRTTAGTYTVTVTGTSGSATQSTTLNLTVQ